MVNVELPIEANLVWQLGKDLLNMYIETEVRLEVNIFVLEYVNLSGPITHISNR